MLGTFDEMEDYYLEGPSKRSFGKREILSLNICFKACHWCSRGKEKRVKLKGNMIHGGNRLSSEPLFEDNSI